MQKQKKAEDFEVIEAEPYDGMGDFRMEPSGHYVLIKILRDTKQIAVGICNKEHEILREFRGKNAEEVWHAIFTFEENNRIEWFTEKRHVAYLGKELNKAELALASESSDYVQD